MNGILLINKPKGFTSFDVVAKLRGMAKTKKVGHSGTLDPMATGVLPVFFGRAVKACGQLLNEDKAYRAILQLGIETDTQDITGTVLASKPVTVSKEQVLERLQDFVGEIRQIPPMYSAIKVEGKRLYDLARQGIEVERKPRSVSIHSIDLLEADEASGRYAFYVACSKGTYIRTLYHDLGRALGCGGCLAALERTMASGFRLEECVTLEEAQSLADAGGLEEALIPVERVFDSLPKIKLDERQEKLFRNGAKLSLKQLGHTQEGLAAVFGEERFLGLGLPDFQKDELRVHKLFSLEGMDQ